MNVLIDECGSPSSESEEEGETDDHEQGSLASDAEAALEVTSFYLSAPLPPGPRPVQCPDSVASPVVSASTPHSPPVAPVPPPQAVPLQGLGLALGHPVPQLNAVSRPSIPTSSAVLSRTGTPAPSNVGDHDDALGEYDNPKYDLPPVPGAHERSRNRLDNFERTELMNKLRDAIIREAKIAEACRTRANKGWRLLRDAGFVYDRVHNEHRYPAGHPRNCTIAKRVEELASFEVLSRSFKLGYHHLLFPAPYYDMCEPFRMSEFIANTRPEARATF
jgi:hypothetical protein